MGINKRGFNVVTALAVKTEELSGKPLTTKEKSILRLISPSYLFIKLSENLLSFYTKTIVLSLNKEKIFFRVSAMSNSKSLLHMKQLYGRLCVG